MLLRAVVLALLFASCLSSRGARAEPRLELLTIGPGDALWERYGHTALRVAEGNRDIVYNFGIAPFAEPSFVWELLRGRAHYFIVGETMLTTFKQYRDADRTIRSQELKLSPGWSRWLVGQLEEAARPPGNHYRYDHLYDNCSTRIRDLIDTASQGALRQAAAGRKPGRSFRDDSLTAQSGHLFASSGFDLMSGPHQDLALRDGYEEMYLPEHLHDRVAEARIEVAGQRVPLAGASRIVYLRKGPPARSLPPTLHRAVLLTLSALLLLSLAVYVWNQRGAALWPALTRRLTWRLLALLCGISALFGVIEVPFRALCTLHGARGNENVWLFFPLDLFLIDPLRERVLDDKRLPRWAQLYIAARVVGVVIVLGLKSLGVLRQHNEAFVLTACAWALAVAYFVVSRPRDTPPAA